MSEISESATPILDRKEPLPRPARRSSGSRMVTAIAACVGAVIGVTAASGHLPFLPTTGNFIQGEFPRAFAENPGAIGAVMPLLTLIAAVFVAVAIHETGHLLAGLVAGFHFDSMKVGPLQISRPFRLSLYRGGGVCPTGWTRMLPAGSEGLVQGALLMVAGGPAASILACVAVLLVPLPKGLFLFWLCGLSLVLGVTNLIPFRGRAFLTDGGRILMLLQDQERAERWMALIRLGSEMRKGVPPEHLPGEFLSKATAVKDDTPDTVIAYAIAHSAALARHDDSSAAECLETCLRYSGCAPPPTRRALMCDAGVFQARNRKRIDLAEQWLADLPAKLKLPWLRTRVEAAILEAQGDVQGAMGKLEEAERLILATPNQALRMSAQRSLQKWKAELQAPPTAE